jgi:hypothetical protein
MASQIFSFSVTALAHAKIHMVQEPYAYMRHFEPFDLPASRYRLFVDARPCDRQLVWDPEFPS